MTTYFSFPWALVLLEDDEAPLSKELSELDDDLPNPSDEEV